MKGVSSTDLLDPWAMGAKFLCLNSFHDYGINKAPGIPVSKVANLAP